MKLLISVDRCSPLIRQECSMSQLLGKKKSMEKCSLCLAAHTHTEYGCALWRIVAPSFKWVIMLQMVMCVPTQAETLLAQLLVTLLGCLTWC